jgi:hypothetical protein
MLKKFSLRYALSTYRMDQLYLPAAFWVLFAIICLFRIQAGATFDMARAYLGAVVPLIGGIMSAYAILDDPALELRFSAPARPGRFLLERLGVILAVQAICAVAFQAFAIALGADLSLLGNFIGVQLAWLVPCLFLMSFSCFGSLLSTQAVTGAFLAGITWLIELLARDWLAQNAGQYVLIFMGALMPGHPTMVLNQATLLGLSLIFTLASWALLRRQERYL